MGDDCPCIRSGTNYLWIGPYWRKQMLSFGAYPPLVAQPPELSIVANKVVQTGPFLDTDAVPSKEQARRILGLAQDELIVLYAPRGFPFGVGFGHQVIRSLFGALSAMQNARQQYSIGPFGR